jgi:hypothetical protein
LGFLVAREFIEFLIPVDGNEEFWDAIENNRGASTLIVLALRFDQELDIVLQYW